MKSLRERTEIQQAYLDGESIESRIAKCITWMIPSGEPKFNWNTHDYRIKPKPMEIWVNFYPEKNMVIHDNLDSSKKGLNKHGITKKFIEVIE